MSFLRQIGTTLGAPVRRWPGACGLITVLLAGSACRVLFSFNAGHAPDIDFFVDWICSLHDNGFKGFYSDVWSNYPPLYILVLWAYGKILSFSGMILSDSEALRVWLRLPACVADVVIAVVLFVEGRRLMGRRAGVAASALYFLNPVSIYDSAYWGQIDSVHTLFVLWAVVCLNRRRPAWAGVAIVLGLLQKLQSIVFLPLILFDIYRWQRWRGLLRCLIAGAITFTVALVPLIVSGSTKQALVGGYSVVGQYNRLSIKAFNLWYLTSRPTEPTEGPPRALVEMAADGEQQVQHDSSLLLKLSWRRISMGLFVLMVAVVLTLYSRCASPSTRALAAGALALVFYLFLTEMHERYAFPVIALLPLWAVKNAWRERLFIVLSVLLLLNLALVQPLDQIGPEISLLNLMIYVVLLFYLMVPARAAPAQSESIEQPDEDTESAPTELEPMAVQQAAMPPPSKLVSWFCRLTVIATALTLVGSTLLCYQYSQLPGTEPDDSVYLSELNPTSHRQGYGEMGIDRSVDGGVLRIGNTYYLRGIGTHAPSRSNYIVPQGYNRFRALAGVDKYFRGAVRVRIIVDQQTLFTSDELTYKSEAIAIDIPVHAGQALKLVTLAGETKKGDHVDWALACFDK